MSWIDVRGPSRMATTAVVAIHHRACRKCSPPSRVYHTYEHGAMCSLRPRHKSVDGEERSYHGGFGLSSIHDFQLFCCHTALGFRLWLNFELMLLCTILFISAICSLLPRRWSADGVECPSHGDFHLPLVDLPQ